MAKKSTSNTTPNAQWFRNQFSSKGFSQNEVAKKIGLRREILSRVLSGTRKLKTEEAISISQVLSIPLEEIIANTGLKNARITGQERRGALSVGGWVDGELKVHQGAPVGPRSAYNPMPNVDGLEVVRLQTGGSPFEGMDGGLVYFQRSKTVLPEAVGRLCIVRLAGTKKNAELLRNVKRGYEAGRYNLFLLNGQLAEESAQLESTSPVLWLKM